jgi:hypothetical protein
MDAAGEAGAAVEAALRSKQNPAPGVANRTALKSQRFEIVRSARPCIARAMMRPSPPNE